MNQHENIQPYIGGGASLMSAELEIQTSSMTETQDDNVVGAWFGAGMYYKTSTKVVLGLDVRFSRGEVTLFNEERNAGGFNIAVMAAYGF